MSKSLKTQYEFLFVGRDEGAFVENYAYNLGEGGDKSGKIFINLEIQQNAHDAEIIGEIIFDTMRKVFFADLENDPYVRFEESLKEINRALNAFRQERNSDFLGKMNVVVAAIVGQTLLLTQTGEAEAYLIRRRFTTTISEGLDDADSKDIFSNIASGELESGDFIMFSSTRLLRYISKNDLGRLIGNNLQTSLQSIKDFLSTEVLSKIALIGVNAFVVDAPGAVTDHTVASLEPVVAHLQREEVYFEPPSVNSEDLEKPPGLDLSGVKSQLSRGVKNLKGTMNSMMADQVDNGSARHPRRFFRGVGDRFSVGNWGKEKLIFAIVFLLIILTIGLWTLRGKAEQDKKLNDLSSQLVQIQEQIASAKTTGQYNKDQAGQMLNDAEAKAIAILNSGYFKDKARQSLDEIMTTRDSLDGVLHPKAELLADLTSKRANVNALGLLFESGQLYAYEYNALYPVLLGKLQDPLTIDDNEKVIAAASYADKKSLLFYTEAGKVIEYKDGRTSFLTTTDGAFKKGVAIEAYGNKIYILDSVGNQIWRYTRRRDQFDAALAYATDVDLKNGISLAIDGNVYVLNQDGFITKLFSGQKEDFPIKKQPVKPLMSPTKIYTQQDMPQIYILEPNESRIMVYMKDEKTGSAVYAFQYIFDDLKGIKDMVVDKETNTLYVLTATAVYRVIL